MEPSLPPLHPEVSGLVDRLGLRVVDAYEWNVLACVERGSDSSAPTHVLKCAADERKRSSLDYETRVLREVLTGLDRDSFEHLSFPDHIDDGSSGGLRWLLMTHLEGTPLVHQWSSLSFKLDALGGKHIDIGVAALAVDAFRDLRNVAVSTLPPFVRRYDHAAWTAVFPKRSAEMVSMGILDDDTAAQAAAFFARDRERYGGTIFTNGDFYPRNFVVMARGGIGLVDWVGSVDVLEFAAMHAWTLMWGNPRWQIAYMQELQRHFPVYPGTCRVAMMARSFDLAYRWRELPEEHIGFARTQMLSYFREALDLDYVRGLLRT